MSQLVATYDAEYFFSGASQGHASIGMRLRQSQREISRYRGGTTVDIIGIIRRPDSC